MSYRMKIAVLLFAGNLKPDVFPTSERIKGYKKQISLRKESGEVDSTIRPSLDMSRQVLEISFYRV